MRPDEWRAVADEVQALWGKTKRWDNAPEAFKYAEKIPAHAAMQAVEQLFLDRQKIPPSPADVLGAAHQFIADVATPDEVARYCDRFGHGWSILSESSEQRHVRCHRCGYETDRPAASVITEGELENGTFDRRAQDLDDRIAP